MKPVRPRTVSTAAFCKAAMARSGSPSCAATRARIVDRRGTHLTASFSSGTHGHRLLRQSQRGGFVTKAHIGQREISNEKIIIRLFFEERFQFATRACCQLSLGGGVIAGDFLRPA